MKKNILFVICLVVIGIGWAQSQTKVRHFKAMYHLATGAMKLEESENATLRERYSTLESDIRRWQSVASEVLSSRGYPIAQPVPNDLRRVRLKTVANMKPVITNGLLRFKVNGLEVPEAMKFTRESTNNSYLNERLFINGSIVAISLENGTMDIEPLSGITPDDILPFVSLVLDAEKGDEWPLDPEHQ